LPTEKPAETEKNAPLPGPGERATPPGILAAGAQSGERVDGAPDNAEAKPEGVLRDAPTAGAKSAA